MAMGKNLEMCREIETFVDNAAESASILVACASQTSAWAAMNAIKSHLRACGHDCQPKSPTEMVVNGVHRVWAPLSSGPVGRSVTGIFVDERAEDSKAEGE
jgi:hypothetical protein